MSSDGTTAVATATPEAPTVGAPAPPVAAPAPSSVGALAAAPTALSLQARATAALARLQELGRQLGPQLQYQIMRVGLAGQVGIAALAAAAAVAVGALLPAYRAVQTLGVDITRAGQHPGSGASIEQAGSQLLASLPTRGQMPAVLGQVFAVAKAAGVSLDAGRYTYTASKSGAVAHYDLEFPLKAASYPNIRTFINGTLTAIPTASLDKLHIERKAVGDQNVSADVGFVVFVRSGEGP